MAGQARLFDLDGTLWASFPWYALVLATAGCRAAEDIEADLRSGMNVIVLADACMPRSRFRAECSRLAPAMAEFAGARETLATLRSDGFLTGIVTSLPGWLADLAIGQLGLAPLDTVVSAATPTARKPSPAPIRYALADLGLLPGFEHVYVGDLPTDRQSATAAGIRFAWASWGYGTIEGATALTRIEEVLGL